MDVVELGTSPARGKRVVIDKNAYNADGNLVMPLGD